MLLWPVYFPNFSAGSVRCAAFADNLVQLGNEVTVVTPSESLGKETIETDSYDVKRISSYDTFSRSLGFGAAMMSFPASFRKTRKAILEVKPDLVIASTPGPLLALEGYLATRRMRIPFVLDVRDPWRASEYLHPGAMRNISKKAIEKFLCVKSDFVFFVTPKLKDMIAGDYGLDSRMVAVVRNGAEDGSEDALEATKEYDLVFLGTPSLYKNLEELFEGLAIASRSYQSRILFVGWIDSPYTRDLKKLVGKLGLSESVEFLPQIPNEHVRGWMSKAKMAINSSGGPPHFACAVGAANYVYLSAALPIAFLSKHPDGEIDNFITEEVGFVANDAETFAKRLVEHMQNPDELRRKSQNALHYSREFSWRRIVSDVYENHLKNLVGDAS